MQSTLTAAQHSQRRSGIGASEVAALLGLDSYTTPLEVWAAKVDPDFHREDSPDLRRGRILESAVADWYQDETGLPIQRSETLALPSCSLVLATPDRIVVGEQDSRWPLELKACRWNQRERFGEPGTDQVPEQYLVQVQQQILVTGSTRGQLAVLLGGDDFRLYEFRADKELQTMIVERIREFWARYVETKVPPPVDGSTAWGERLKRLPRARKAITADEHLRALVSDLRRAKEEAKQAAEREDELRNLLLASMGDADEVEGLLTYRETKGRASVDWKALVKAKGISEAEVEQFTTRKPYRVLRLRGGNDE